MSNLCIYVYILYLFDKGYNSFVQMHGKGKITFFSGFIVNNIKSQVEALSHSSASNIENLTCFFLLRELLSILIELRAISASA